MPKLALKVKTSSLKIKRKEAGNNSYIAINDPENFNLLKDNRCENELFSRVDKFWVNHYYYAGTEQLKEIIFYPSEYGIEEIEKERNHPCEKLYKKLIDEGIGIRGERPIPNIKKPIQRLELECKPKRMQLKCKE